MTRRSHPHITQRRPSRNFTTVSISDCALLCDDVVLTASAAS
jgi:hypothetical protein